MIVCRADPFLLFSRVLSAFQVKVRSSIQTLRGKVKKGLIRRRKKKQRTDITKDKLKESKEFKAYAYYMSFIEFFVFGKKKIF